MNYTLHQLEIFVKVAEKESITKASEELFLTQPAVSLQLKKLQEQFEYPLTEIVGRKLYITDFGKELLEVSKRILSEAQSIRNMTNAFGGNLVGKLRISSVSTGKYVMPFFISNFIKENPQVDLEMDVTNKELVVKSLQENKIDFALVSLVPDNLDCEEVPLMSNKLFLIGNSERKFNKTAYKSNIFEELPMIFREQGSATRQTMEKYFREQGLKIDKKMEFVSNEAVKQAVMAGLGYSIMPLIGLRNELSSKQLQIIPVKGFPISTTWRLVYLKQKRFGPVAKEFLNYILAEKEHLVAQKFNWYEEYK